MKLTNKMPPGGYYYKDDRLLPWQVAPRSELALEGVGAVAGALSIIRSQNPSLGLDSSIGACVAEVTRFTCARFDALPAMQRRYCRDEPVLLTPESFSDIPPIKARRGGCSSCGGGRKR